MSRYGKYGGMKNYQQVAFSINNLEKRTVQDIEIPATDGIVKKKFEISFGLSEDGFNDCLLLLLEKNGKDNVFSMRFTIQKGKREGSDYFLRFRR